MEDASLYGTNADQSANDEYCGYCFKGGNFTSDVDLDGMIAACVPYMTESIPDMTEAKAEAMMRAFLPQLKRWKR